MAVKTKKKASVKKGISAPKVRKATKPDIMGIINTAILSMTESIRASVTESIRESAAAARESVAAARESVAAARESAAVARESVNESIRESAAAARESVNESIRESAAAVDAEILKLAGMLQETERIHQETKRAHRETELAQKRAEESIDRLSNSINYGLGGLRNSIGHIIEMLLLPGLSTKMNELGHIFTKASYGNVFKRADGSALAELDLYLENGNEVMVVEAKTFFEEKDVTALLERVQKLRNDEELTGVAGKTIYAGAAGVNFAPEARKKIEAKGIYLVEVNEENDKIKVKEISIEEAGTW